MDFLVGSMYSHTGTSEFSKKTVSIAMFWVSRVFPHPSGRRLSLSLSNFSLAVPSVVRRSSLGEGQCQFAQCRRRPRPLPERAETAAPLHCLPAQLPLAHLANLHTQYDPSPTGRRKF